MSDDIKPRDIIHEMADVLRLLDDDYTTAGVDCSPGDSAMRITKRNSEKTMYVIAYSDPADTELRVYDGDDTLTIQHTLYNGAFDGYAPKDIADYITKTI